MNSDKNRIDVTIYGQQYTIVGNESTAHLFQVAKLVNDQMIEIRNKNINFDPTKVAVLTAVNVMHENLVMLERINELEKEIQDIRGRE